MSDPVRRPASSQLFPVSSALAVKRSARRPRIPATMAAVPLAVLLNVGAMNSALATGGAGGSIFGGTGGVGGFDAAVGVGGPGAAHPALTNAGGGGGGAGATGGDGGTGNGGATPGGLGAAAAGAAGGSGVDAPAGSFGGGGGGGGGAHGAVRSASASDAGAAGGSGGVGGHGGSVQGAGGGGGAGGWGVAVSGVAVVYTMTGSAQGGAGGAGGNSASGNAPNGGDGGTGGTGVGILGSATLVNSGSITGGNGGVGGAGSNAAGANGAGGAGVSGSGITIVTSGAISGGLSGDGVTRANAISFTGGANTLTLQTGATFNGDIAIQGGTLSFAQATDQALNSAITGGGGLIKNGAGKLDLTGTNTYTGATLVNAGVLLVNGSIASSVTVNAGSTLGGTGTINGAVSLAAGGVLAPGNSIGTITVNGNVNFAPGSFYRVEVDAAGSADRINATGTATISGGTVDVRAGAGSYQASTQYTILNASGGVTGGFAAVTSDLAFLTPSLTYDANNVFLRMARNDISFVQVAQTPNQRAAAAALPTGAGASGDMATVVNAVTGLSTSQALQAYDAIGGASLVALRRAGAAFSGGFGQQLTRRLGAVASGDAVQVASAGEPQMAMALLSAQRMDQRGFWLRGYGAGSNTDSDGNAAANALRGGGLSMGIDTEVRKGLVLGAALTHGRSRVSFDSVADKGHSRGNALGVYGGLASGPWAFKGHASLARSANDMDRAVVVGPLARTASADFDSRSLSMYAEATYDLQQADYLLQPLVALSLVRTRTDGFTETGAGALNLQVAQQSTRSTRTLVGAKTVHELGKLKIEPRLLWAHEFGNVNAPMFASFMGAPAAGSFQVSGVALKRDSLILGLGVSGQIRKGLALVADGELEVNSRQRNLAVAVALRGVW